MKTKNAGEYVRGNYPHLTPNSDQFNDMVNAIEGFIKTSTPPASSIGSAEEIYNTAFEMWNNESETFKDLTEFDTYLEGFKGCLKAYQPLVDWYNNWLNENNKVDSSGISINILDMLKDFVRQLSAPSSSADSNIKPPEEIIGKVLSEYTGDNAMDLYLKMVNEYHNQFVLSTGVQYTVSKAYLCPKCNGDVNLARYNSPALSTNATPTCDICHGAKVLYEVPAPVEGWIKVEELKNILLKIQQMSDSGSYEKGIIEMKSLAGDALDVLNTN